MDAPQPCNCRDHPLLYEDWCVSHVDGESYDSSAGRRSSEASTHVFGDHDGAPCGAVHIARVVGAPSLAQGQAGAPSKTLTPF